VSRLTDNDCPCIIECWYLVSLLLSKFRKHHLLNYSDVTQESIVITLLFSLVMYVMYYSLLLC
jgi:hypothetical protein